MMQMSRTAIHPWKILAALGAALLVWGLVLAYASSPAWASTITVDNPADDPSGACSLREAITAANTDARVDACAAGSGADTIELPTGTYQISSALPDITTTVTIDGASLKPTIDGGNAVRPFFVASGAQLSLNSITLIKANSSTASGPQDGGAILNEGTLEVSNVNFFGNSSPYEGGAILNDGANSTLEVSDSFFSGNTGGDGGAIRNEGTLEVSNTTFSGNRAGNGGALHSDGSGTATVVTSTFSGNSATVFGGAIYSENTLNVTNSTFSGNKAKYGGGIFKDFSNTQPTVTNSTFTLNSASIYGGGIFNLGGTISPPILKNTIVANSTSGGDCVGKYGIYYGDPESGATDGGYNLIGDGSCVTEATSLSGVDPMLDPLGSHGGFTQTHRLREGSPAIDAIPVGTNGCGSDITQDQRGVSRPQGSGCDIGAFELAQLGEPPNEPPSKQECKKGGYRELGFKNQGQCIKAVNAKN